MFTQNTENSSEFFRKCLSVYKKISIISCVFKPFFKQIISVTHATCSGIKNRPLKKPHVHREPIYGGHQRAQRSQKFNETFDLLIFIPSIDNSFVQRKRDKAFVDKYLKLAMEHPLRKGLIFQGSHNGQF
jgi:hypothetical protein